MACNDYEIRDDSFVTDIVIQDYRTSVVFRKYGIDYCCGGKQPLLKVCELRGLDVELIKNELRLALRTIHISNSTNFYDWNPDFLVDYIINVHHNYLHNNFPDIVSTLTRVAESHQSKYPYLPEALDILCQLRDYLLPLLEQEEKIIFPYIKQITYAYKNNESYAALLVRTLRKPIENMTKHEHERIAKYIHQMRDLTKNYAPGANLCISHRVAISKLNELDNDLTQHIHLESNILFPKAMAMEKEMLELK